MRKQVLVTDTGKTTDIFGISGTVKQVYFNSYSGSTGEKKAEKLKNSVVSLKVQNEIVIDDYRGSDIEGFNVLEEAFHVGERTSIDVEFNKHEGTTVDPLLITFVYEK